MKTKPFKAKTKTGEKWYVVDDGNLIEVAAEDVPGIVARIDEAERVEQANAAAPTSWANLIHEEPDSLELMALAQMGMSTDGRFPNKHRI